MVRGRGMAVTAVALMYQCALTTRIARGRGTDSPKDLQAAVYLFSEMAFIGLPCPKNAAGITRGSAATSHQRLSAGSVPEWDNQGSAIVARPAGRDSDDL